jgi:hypothetical protein
MSQVITSPGSFTVDVSGTLDAGQYFLDIFGRCEGALAPFSGSFHGHALLTLVSCHCSRDFNNDGDVGTDADIEAFFACLGGAAARPAARRTSTATGT